MNSFVKQIIMNSEDGELEGETSSGRIRTESRSSNSNKTRNVISDINSKSELKVVITTLHDFDEVLSFLDIRKDAVSNAKQIEDTLFYEEEPVKHSDINLLSMLIATAIRTKIKKTLDDNSVQDMSVTDVLTIASSYRMIVESGCRMTSKMNMKIGRLMQMFDVHEPFNRVDTNSEDKE